MDIVITLPAKIKWEEYEQELEKVKNNTFSMNFKVPTKPDVKKGDKCYLCYKNNIIGFMYIVGIYDGRFTCTTTNQDWNGIFVQRSGPFYKLKNPIPYKGFQGYRYFDKIFN